MRLVHVAKDTPGVVELNWMWLPTFISQNHLLMQKLQKELSQQFLGRETDDDTLDEIDEFVLDKLQEMFNVDGLREYLSGLHQIG